MGFNIQPISKTEMARKVYALDDAYHAEFRKKWRKRVSEPRSFSMSDIVSITGRAQEHLIGLEEKGSIPRATRVGKKRFYRWSEEDARLLIAIVQALPHRKQDRR